MIGHKDTKPTIEGWYSVRLKSNLSPVQREMESLASSFIDWVFFDGIDWDNSEYKKLGFYVADIIMGDKTYAKN